VRQQQLRQRWWQSGRQQEASVSVQQQPRKAEEAVIRSYVSVILMQMFLAAVS
jgi:hypothetical protein